MATTQYIGARYVPLFATPLDWSIETEYEPLTIVYHAGNSYTSRQSVPKGIDISDTKYWALTGNYNAQIEQYRREVAAYDGRITENAQKIADEVTRAVAEEAAIKELIETEATRAKAAEEAAQTTADNALSLAQTNEKDIATLDSEMAGTADSGLKTLISNETSRAQNAESANASAISLLHNSTAYKGHRMVIIGDSYAYGTGASDHKAAEKLRFSTKLASMLGTIEVNVAVGSTGFCDPGSSGQNQPFPTQVDTAKNKLSATERADVKLVVISGGINDEREGTTYSGSDMINAAKSTCTKARAAFPNADIYVFPMLWNGQLWQYHAFNFEQRIIEGVLKSECAIAVSGCWTWNFGVAANIASDNLHPTDAGHANIAQHMFNCIASGSINDYENRLQIVDSIDGSSTANRTYGIFQNGLMNFGGMYVGTEGTSITSSTKIGQVNNAMVPQVNLYVPIYKSNKQVGCLAITTSGAIYLVPTETITLPCFVAPFSYIPYGSALN